MKDYTNPHGVQSFATVQFQQFRYKERSMSAFARWKADRRYLGQLAASPHASTVRMSDRFAPWEGYSAR
jgi:hypothetical protein